MRMLRLSTSLIIFFSLPLFVFGQAMSTSTAIQEPDFMEQRAEVQSQINQMAQDFIDSFPTQEEIIAGTIKDNIDLSIEPKNPAPNENVSMTLTSLLTDISSARIEWLVNGRVVSSGVGQKKHTIKLGDSLQTTTVVVNVTTANGSYISKRFLFTPLGISMLWEADTYTPPFYKGKPLISPESRVRVIAVPDTEGGKNYLSAGNLVYTWEKNMSTITDSSGYGKNTFSFTAPDPYENAKVSVIVSSLDGSLGTKKVFETPLVNPFVLFYENHPLLGTWYNTTLGTNLSLSKKEFSIAAAPYFFSNDSSEQSSFTYKWSLNNRVVQNPGITITLRNDQNTSGDSLLAFAMRGIKQTFQTANRSLVVRFTEDETARPTF